MKITPTIKRKLGNSDIKINPIIMGCWQIGGKPFWQNIKDSESIEMLSAAHEAGINAFDTAPGYGEENHSEVILGKAFKHHRKEVYIFDKVFADKLKYQQVIDSCEKSLKSLQTDYIDLLQIHFPSGCFGSDIVPIEETLDAFKKLQQDGKIREIGVSNFSLAQLKKAQQHASIASIQPPYSLFWRHVADEITLYCQDNHISILAYSPLAQGLLTGRFKHTNNPFDKKEVRSLQKLCEPHIYPKVQLAIKRLEPIAYKNNITLTELTLAWLISQPETMAVVGTRTKEQAEINARIGSLVISEQNLLKIDDIGREVTAHLNPSDPLMWNF